MEESKNLMEMDETSTLLSSNDFLKPELPNSTQISINKRETRTRTQRRGREDDIDNSNDDGELSCNSNKSTSNKKARSEKNTNNRLSFLEAQNTELTEKLKSSYGKIEALEKKMQELEAKISVIMNKDNERINQIINPNQDSIDFWKKLPKQTTHEITKAVIQETAQLDKKEKNIIIFGIPETHNENDELQKTSDKTKIDRLFEDIQVKSEVKVFKFRRLKAKKNQNTASPIIIEFESSADKYKILKATKLLDKTGKHKNIYINPDRTFAELEMEKKLRTERNQKNNELEYTGDNNLKFGKHSFADGKEPENFYWGIRSGKLQRIKIIETQILLN